MVVLLRVWLIAAIAVYVQNLEFGGGCVIDNVCALSL